MASAVELQWSTDRSLGDTRTWAETKLLPALGQYGFALEQRTVDSILLIRRRTAWWLVFFSVIAFWLSPDEKQHVSLSFAADGAGSRMTVVGDVPSKIRRILTDMPGCREVFLRRG